MSLSLQGSRGMVFAKLNNGRTPDNDEVVENVDKELMVSFDRAGKKGDEALGEEERVEAAGVDRAASVAGKPRSEIC